MPEDKRIYREVVQVTGETAETLERSVVRELPLTITINGKEFITLLTTGDANKELTIGFLLSEGFLKKKED